MHTSRPVVGSRFSISQEIDYLRDTRGFNPDELLRRAEEEHKVREKGPLGAFLNRLALLSVPLGPERSKKEIEAWAQESAAAVRRTHFGQQVGNLAVGSVIPLNMSARERSFDRYGRKLSDEINRIDSSKGRIPKLTGRLALFGSRDGRQTDENHQLKRSVKHFSTTYTDDELRRGQELDMLQVRSWVEDAVETFPDLADEGSGAVIITDQVTFAEVRRAEIAADHEFPCFTGDIGLSEIGNELMVLSEIDQDGALRWSRSNAGNHYA